MPPKLILGDNPVETAKAGILGALALAQGVYAVQGALAAIVLLYSVGVRATTHSMVSAADATTHSLTSIMLQAGGGGGGGGGTASALGSALCDIGLGALITAALFLISIALIYGSLGDLYNWFAKSKSKDSGRRAESGGHLQSAGKKIGGGIVIGASPTILAAIGFSLLSCVSAVNPFA